MIQLIVGNKGKGKTKHLLEKVNAHVKEISGNIVYLDKDQRNMYELNNKIRLIDMSEYCISNSDEFAGFICGIISQNRDIQELYFDSFLKIACLENKDITETIDKLDKISERYNVNFVISAGIDEIDLPENLKSKIILSL